MKKSQQKKSKLILYGSYAVLILLIVTFVGVPILGGQLGSGTFNVFGKYGFKEIKYSTNNIFGRNVQNIDYYYSQVNPESRNSAFYARSIWKQGFEQTVQIYALLDIARKNKFQLSDDKIRDIIRDLPQLQDEDGNFDRDLYNSLDDNTRSELITETRERNVAQKIREDILDETFISDNERVFYHSLNENKKSFNFVKLDKNKVSDTNVIKNYGRSNIELFKSISYKSITVETKEEAEKIREQIISKEKTFDESIIEFSIDSAKENPDAPGDRGTSYAYQVKNTDGEDILLALLALQTTDDVSDVVQTLSENYAFYQLTREIEIPQFDTADETLITTVEDYMKSYDSGILEDEVYREAGQFIEQAKVQGFSQAAASKETSVGTIPLAPLNIENISLLDQIRSEGDSDIGNLVNTEDILAEIYTLKNIDDISKPLIMDGYIYVFQLADVKTADDNFDSIPDGFQSNISNFVQSSNQRVLQKAVVDENKFTDNFDSAYELLYQ